MKDDKITVISPNMVRYDISVRDAYAENDVFRVAFETACKADKPESTEEELLAWDFFRYGWEAAVNLLNDDPIELKPYFGWEAYETQLIVKTMQSETSEEAKAFYNSLK